MAVAFHTNGTTTLTVDGQTLGQSSSDGVTFAPNKYDNEIYTDNRGPNIPEEVLHNGIDGMISLELWKYDDAVLSAFMAKRDGGNIGQMGIIGDLMFTNSRTSTLQLASPRDGKIYTFNRVWLVNEQEVKLSTQLKVWALKIKAVPDANGYLYILS